MSFAGLLGGGGGVGSGVSIGDAIGGADPDRILFTDASANLAQSLELFYDSAGNVFSVGGGTGATSMTLGGNLQIYDGTGVYLNAGISTGVLEVNPGNSGSISFRIHDTTVGEFLMWTDATARTITFGDAFDLGGTFGFVALGTGDSTIIVRQLVGQTGKLTSWQNSGLSQLIGVNVSGELECGSTSQGVKISGATTGILTFTGYGNANNESLSLNFESVANSVAVTSSTGVTAMTFSGFGLSASSFTGSVIMTDNVGLSMGSGTDARLEFDTSEGNDTLKLGLVCNSVNSSGNFIICESADINTNFGASTVINPTLRIQSADATSTADFVAIYHDQTDGRIDVGAGNLKIGNTIDLSTVSAGTANLIITATSDTPTVTWGAAAGNEASAAPAGYLEITVGGNARYIPFWA